MRASRAYCALRVTAHVTGSAAPGIRAPDHDISPPVEEQLVLELDFRYLARNGSTSSQVADAADSPFH